MPKCKPDGNGGFMSGEGGKTKATKPGAKKPMAKKPGGKKK